MKTHKLLYILPLAALVACEPEFEDVEFNQGSADFSKTVAVGNSLTAGYQSGALSLEGQINSLPAIVARQMQEVGGGEFKQPLLTGEFASKGVGIDLKLNPSTTGQVQPKLVLRNSQNCLGETALGPVRLTDPYVGLPALATNSVAASGPYNNVGIPGAKLVDLDQPSFATSNPFYARISTGGSLIDLAASVNASFFMMWIGNNDVLTFATEGGDESPTGAILTDESEFNTKYDAAINTLILSGANKGVVANIPDVTTIPYFTTIKWNALVLTEEQADFFNSHPLVVGYNTALENPSIIAQFKDGAAEADRRKLNFKAGANGFLMLDNDLSTAYTDTMGTELPKYRQLVSGELVTLSASGDEIRCEGLGSADLSDPQNPVINPMTGGVILDLDEIQRIKDATNSYNTTIKKAANDYQLAHVDVNARLKELQTGITISGISFNSELVTGGAFSLDGVHPSTRGYAILANDFIDAINRTYNANVPKVDVASYSTIEVE